MSVVDFSVPDVQVPVLPPKDAPSHGPPQSLHRLAMVRRIEGVSRRTIARKLATTIDGVRAQEQGSNDLPLSALYRWAEALEVPVAELLNEPEMGLSAPIAKRAQAVRIMKTAKAIVEVGRGSSRRLGEMLVEQILELMPELKDTVPWPLVGQRRQPGDIGRAGRHPIPLAALSPDLLD